VEVPPISVVLTTFNRAHVLPQTIEDILSQTFADFELIISDNCSLDNTREICERYVKMDSRVRCRRNAVNIGMPGNLNEGIRSARGAYIANCHDGDRYAPNTLEEWKQALDRYPNAGFVFNAYRHLNADGTERVVTRLDLPSCVDGRAFLRAHFLRRRDLTSPVWGTVMARRAVYDEFGLFNSRFGIWADVDMWMKIAGRYDVAYVQEPLISLPRKRVLPSQEPASILDYASRMEAMFREARVRCYGRHRVRLAGELTRHYAYFCHALGRAVCANVAQKIVALSSTRKHAGL
jgi:glycosyltransferase involved in cell wall biosynthesis